VNEHDPARLERLLEERRAAVAAGNEPGPLVAGPDHALLATEVASGVRELLTAAAALADLVRSWQRQAVLCGLFDEVDDAKRPAGDWRAQIDEALTFVDEATA
jgi:hypothetical protein